MRAERDGSIVVSGIRGGEGSKVILDSRVGEGLAPTRRVQHIHFIGRAGKGAHFASTPKAPERCEARGFPTDGPFLLFLRRLRIDKIHGDSLKAKFMDIGEAGYRAGSVVVVGRIWNARISSVDIFVERPEYFSSLKGRHIEKAAPNFGGRETASGKACNNTEIIRTALKGTPELGVN